MLNNDRLILGETNESRLQSIVGVLAVFGDLLSNSKIYNDSVKSKVKNILSKINDEELFKSNIQLIWGGLNEKQRNNLTQIATNWLSYGL